MVGVHGTYSKKLRKSVHCLPSNGKVGNLYVLLEMTQSKTLILLQNTVTIHYVPGIFGKDSSRKCSIK